jgi:hypothetical protein
MRFSCGLRPVHEFHNIILLHAIGCLHNIKLTLRQQIYERINTTTNRKLYIIVLGYSCVLVKHKEQSSAMFMDLRVRSATPCGQVEFLLWKWSDRHCCWQLTRGYFNHAPLCFLIISRDERVPLATALRTVSCKTQAPDVKQPHTHPRATL